MSAASSALEHGARAAVHERRELAARWHARALGRVGGHDARKRDMDISIVTEIPNPVDQNLTLLTEKLSRY